MSSSIPSGATNGNTEKAPHVLIAGGGLAGLFLGNLLEKAGISYTIYERTAQIKPLGKLFFSSQETLCCLHQSRESQRMFTHV
jgi:2-polyprenyl-6-methoxyphenol hydroxylase-like FAD-dependent oxidoreductase